MKVARESPHRRRSTRIALGAALAVVLGGTLGYMWIESWTLLDAFYMTVIALSTVGFGEVRPLSTAGQLFTVGLIVGGVASLGYALGLLGRRLLEAPERRLRRKIRRMKHHTIICGYGRIAQPIVEGLLRLKRPFCVIERSARSVEALTEAGIPAVTGDATAEEVLETAGVRQATTIAALLPSDGDNLSIAMTATALQPRIRVMARSEEERSRANLERAGAHPHDVVSPYTTAGNALLQNLFSPGTARIVRGLDQVTQGGFDTGTLAIVGGGPFAGKTLTEAALGERHKVLVLAVQRAGSVVTVAPAGKYRIRSGDTLILVGNPGDLQRLGAQTGK